MSQVLRVNATDQRVTKIGRWTNTYDMPLTCVPSDSLDCQFFLMFRGTGIRLYGGSGSNAIGTLRLALDGNVTEIIQLNGTTLNDTVYRNERMADGDHQLMGYFENGTFFLDHFEIENLSGHGFDLLNTGSNAHNVPTQAVIVDNIDPAIIYHNGYEWFNLDGSAGFYGGSVSSALSTGASLSFSFDGVAIWYYGSLCLVCASFKVSIDGSTPQRLNASSALYLNQQMIWSNTSLDPGRHTITLTHDDMFGGRLLLDFFRVLPGAGSSILLSSISTTDFGELPTTVPPVPPTSQNQTNRVPLAIGLTLGLLVLVLAVLCGVRHIYLRRGRRLDLYAHSVSPYTGPPIWRADQQSSIPQVRKGAPQPTRLSGAPMATVDPAMSSGVTGLGPPPCYETPTWRVDRAH